MVGCQDIARNSDRRCGNKGHLQVLGEERVARVLVHALLKRDAGLAPLDRISPVHNDIFSFCDLHSAGGVCGDVDLNDTVPIVEDVKVDVGEEVVLQLMFLPGLCGLGHDLLHLANEPPDWQIIVKHLHVHMSDTL